MAQWRAVIRRVQLIDDALHGYSDRLPPSRADPLLRGLSRAANHSVLWLTSAALLALRKGPTRRAAVRGVAALGASSFTANAVAKRVIPRQRPIWDSLPPWRRIVGSPTSPAFPSGHAASAAAFATGVAMECPSAGLVIAPVAAAVGYSRVHVGAHWPSDVLAGAALGTGIALATRRWWPVRPEQPARARPRGDAPALPQGRGLVVLANKRSGDEGVDPAERVAEALPAARVIGAPDGGDLGAALEEAVDGALAVGIAGGDGSVGAAAAVADRRGLPLMVAPEGTLNHFARDVGIGSLEQAAEAVSAGDAVGVDLGIVEVECDPVDGRQHRRCFVNTASLGGYPDLVRLREQWEPRWGKWPAGAAALVRVLAQASPLTVEIDGRRRKLWLLFVGNGVYHPRGVAPMWRPRLDSGLLDVRYLLADLPFSRTRFLAAAATGALARSRTYVQECVSSVDVRVLGDPVTVATDGEVELRGGSFHFRVAPGRLVVYRPADEPVDTA